MAKAGQQGPLSSREQTFEILSSASAFDPKRHTRPGKHSDQVLLKHESPCNDGDAIVEPLLDVELLIVTRIENERDLADKGRVSQPRANSVDVSFEPLKNGRHARTPIIAELAVVVADDTEDQAILEILADGPLEMDVIAAVIIRGFVLAGQYRRRPGSDPLGSGPARTIAQ